MRCFLFRKIKLSYITAMERYTDPFVCCPYNRQHRVPRSRLQQHLIKCEKTYPSRAICPYNSTHRCTKEQINAHVSDCPDREQYLTEDKPHITTAILTTPEPTPQKEYLGTDDPDYESWD